jgi:hypothetical protein
MTTDPQSAMRAWLFVLPALIAVPALGWAVLHPSVVCVSETDTIVCADYSDAKFIVATAGVGVALVISGLLGLVIRFRRGAIAAGVAVGLALIGLAVGAYIRGIT